MGPPPRPTPPPPPPRPTHPLPPAPPPRTSSATLAPARAAPARAALAAPPCGAVSLRSPAAAEYCLALTKATAFPADWRPRFADAYRLQNQAWTRAISAGKLAEEGASAWDGYAAALIAEAGLRSLSRGVTVKI